MTGQLQFKTAVGGAAQAEQVVSIVGIKNAQAGYFRGETKLMGAP